MAHPAPGNNPYANPSVSPMQTSGSPTNPGVNSGVGQGSLDPVLPDGPSQKTPDGSAPSSGAPTPAAPPPAPTLSTPAVQDASQAQDKSGGKGQAANMLAMEDEDPRGLLGLYAPKTARNVLLGS